MKQNYGKINVMKIIHNKIDKFQINLYKKMKY